MAKRDNEQSPRLREFSKFESDSKNPHVSTNLHLCFSCFPSTDTHDCMLVQQKSVWMIQAWVISMFKRLRALHNAMKLGSRLSWMPTKKNLVDLLCYRTLQCHIWRRQHKFHDILNRYEIFILYTTPQGNKLFQFVICFIFFLFIKISLAFKFIKKVHFVGTINTTFDVHNRAWIQTGASSNLVSEYWFRKHMTTGLSLL